MGGAEKLLTELAPAQKTHGYDVDICVFDPTTTPFMTSLRESGINIIHLGPKSNPYDFKRIPALRRLMNQYDIVHAHCTSPQYLCALASVGTKCKLITTEHSTNNRRRNKRWLKPLENWVYGRYSSIIGCSEKAAENLKEYLSKLHSRISCIPNGIDITKYANAENDKSLLYQCNDEFRLIMVGRFHHPKNQKFLIKAISRLEERIHLYLVGDGDTFNDCITMAKNNGVIDRVHFLGRRSHVPKILKSVDVMTHSSYWEGLPVSILEGMAAGLPIVASDAPGIREIVKDVGLLFEPDSIEQFANCVNQLIYNKKFYIELSKKSSDSIQDYSIEQMANQYLKVYESV